MAPRYYGTGQANPSTSDWVAGDTVFVRRGDSFTPSFFTGSRRSGTNTLIIPNGVTLRPFGTGARPIMSGFHIETESNVSILNGVGEADHIDDDGADNGILFTDMPSGDCWIWVGGSNVTLKGVNLKRLAPGSAENRGIDVGASAHNCIIDSCWVDGESTTGGDLVHVGGYNTNTTAVNNGFRLRNCVLKNPGTNSGDCLHAVKLNGAEIHDNRNLGVLNDKGFTILISYKGGTSQYTVRNKYYRNYHLCTGGSGPRYGVATTHNNFEIYDNYFEVTSQASFNAYALSQFMGTADFDTYLTDIHRHDNICVGPWRSGLMSIHSGITVNNLVDEYNTVVNTAVRTYEYTNTKTNSVSRRNLFWDCPNDNAASGGIVVSSNYGPSGTNPELDSQYRPQLVAAQAYGARSNVLWDAAGEPVPVREFPKTFYYGPDDADGVTVNTSDWIDLDSVVLDSSYAWTSANFTGNRMSGNAVSLRSGMSFSGVSKSTITGVGIIAAVSCTVANLTLRNTSGYGINVTGNNVTLDNIDVGSCGSGSLSGVRIGRVSNLTVTDCDFHDAPGSDNVTIDVTSGSASNITFSDCTFTNPGPSNGNNLRHANVTNLIVEDCAFAGVFPAVQGHILGTNQVTGGVGQTTAASAIYRRNTFDGGATWAIAHADSNMTAEFNTFRTTNTASFYGAFWFGLDNARVVDGLNQADRDFSNIVIENNFFFDWRFGINVGAYSGSTNIWTGVVDNNTFANGVVNWFAAGSGSPTTRVLGTATMNILDVDVGLETHDIGVVMTDNWIAADNGDPLLASNGLPLNASAVDYGVQITIDNAYSGALAMSLNTTTAMTGVRSAAAPLQITKPIYDQIGDQTLSGGEIIGQWIDLRDAVDATIFVKVDNGSPTVGLTTIIETSNSSGDHVIELTRWTTPTTSNKSYSYFYDLPSSVMFARARHVGSSGQTITVNAFIGSMVR